MQEVQKMNMMFSISTKFRRFKQYSLYLLVITPFLTEFMEDYYSAYPTAGWITEITVSILICVVVSVIIKQYNTLQLQSLTDHLTGISNRRQFEIDLQREIFRARRLKMKVALIFFDLDGFKMINDTYGHKTGDMVLMTFADCLTLFTRKGIDFCYRFGGDEFAVLQTNLSTDEETGIEDRIEQKFSTIISGKLPEGVSASKGVAVLQEDETLHDLISRADRAMYVQKQRRKSISENIPA